MKRYEGISAQRPAFCGGIPKFPNPSYLSLTDVDCRDHSNKELVPRSCAG